MSMAIAMAIAMAISAAEVRLPAHSLEQDCIAVEFHLFCT
jgi:hypothetical protein